MKKQNRGIVLTQKNKVVSLIDEVYGRVLATTFHTLTVGGLYVYDLVEYGKIYAMNDEELVMVPFDVARNDILFLHHLFEICILFAPIGSCVQGVFQLLLWLYMRSELWFSEKHKKFIVFKLLSSLGIWPYEQVPSMRLLQCAEIPIDRINEEILELISEKEIEHWLYQSVLHYPLFAKMKTKIFLERTHCHD